MKGPPTYGTQLPIAHGVVIARKPCKQLCDAPCRRSCCGVPAASPYMYCLHAECAQRWCASDLNQSTTGCAHSQVLDVSVRFTPWSQSG